LLPVLRAGVQVYQPPPLAESRERTQAQLGMLDGAHKRLAHPHTYPVGLEAGLHAFRTSLILRARGVA